MAEETKPNIISSISQKGPDNKGFLSKRINEDGSAHYGFVLNTEVGNPIAYVDLVHALLSAKDEDTVHIVINSPGGCVDVGITICNAIFNTRATVTTEISGMGASIAAVIWCCGHKRIIAENGTLMFHMTSALVYGKTLTVAEKMTGINTAFATLLKKVTKGILTEEELDLVIEKRADLYLFGAELNKRIKQKTKSSKVGV